MNSSKPRDLIRNLKSSLCEMSARPVLGRVSAPLRLARPVLGRVSAPLRSARHISARSASLSGRKFFLKDDTGSASVELVIFALPLFVPLILLATHLTTVSASKIELSHLARTSLRAFSSAESTSLGHARINQVLMLAESKQRNLESSGLSQLNRFSYRIECQRTPCIQPLNRLRLTLADKSVGSEITVTTSTDQWIEAESGFNYQDPELFFGYRDITEFNERFSPILEAADVVDRVQDLFGETK